MARLNIFGTFADNFISFAGGNPGALNTLFELQKEAKDRTALFLFINNIPLYFLVVTVLAADHAE